MIALACEVVGNGASWFPLIPLPIKEAIFLFISYDYKSVSFPLIPLPIKEAMFDS